MSGVASLLGLLGSGGGCSRLAVAAPCVGANDGEERNDHVRGTLQHEQTRVTRRVLLVEQVGGHVQLHNNIVVRVSVRDSIIVAWRYGIKDHMEWFDAMGYIRHQRRASRSRCT